MKESEPYVIEVLSNKYFEVARQITEGMRVTARNPSQITDFSFNPLDTRQKVTTAVSIKWKNTQLYPKDLLIIINYDRNQVRPILDDNNKVQCVFSRTMFVDCVFKDDYILIEKFLPTEIQPNTQLSLLITSMQFQVTKAITTNSWQLRTYLDGVKYQIDEIKEGLTHTYMCNFPCESCEEGRPDICTECNQIDGVKILYDNICYERCPTGTFYESYQCKPCDERCATCDYNSGSICTSCKGGFSPYPFLDGNTCTDECAFGFYGDREKA